MESQAAKHLVKAAWQAFARRDPDQIAAYFTDDAEWLAPAGNATAQAMNLTHHMIGKEQIARFIGRELGTFFHQVQIDFRGFYADGSVVVVEERMRALLPNGTAYENDYCFVFELEGDRIRRVREYMDTARGQRQIFPPGSEDRAADELGAASSERIRAARSGP